MRLGFVAALAGLLVLSVAAPALAEDQLLPAGECNVGIANRNAEGSRECTAAILRRETATGRLTLVFQFTDGFRLEVGGPYVALGSQTSLTPDQILWANPGQTTPQVDANTPEQRVIRGRCVIANFRGHDQIGAIGCRLSGPLGRIGVAFKSPPPEKKRD